MRGSVSQSWWQCLERSVLRGFKPFNVSLVPTTSPQVTHVFFTFTFLSHFLLVFSLLPYGLSSPSSSLRNQALFPSLTMPSVWEVSYHCALFLYPGAHSLLHCESACVTDDITWLLGDKHTAAVKMVFCFLPVVYSEGTWFNHFPIDPVWGNCGSRTCRYIC